MAKRRKTSQKRHTNQRIQRRKIDIDTAVVILIVAGFLSSVLIYFKSGYIRTITK